MKVLIDYQGTPFSLAHGGADIQIRHTCEALRSIGVEVDYLRWWDNKQNADVIHTFTLPNDSYLKFAKGKKIPVVCTTLFTANCNQPWWQQSLKGLLVSSVLSTRRIPLVSTFRGFSRWDSFRDCSCNVVGLQAEADVLKKIHGVHSEKIRVIPLGLNDIFLNAGKGPRNSDYLITTGTLTERKRSVELAEIAHETETPILFVGKPYSLSDPYWKRFSKLIDEKFVRHIQHTENPTELITLLHQARGYVLDSYYENWCLAAHEAIACGLPILVPDQRWSRERFGAQAHYLSSNRSAKKLQISEFYQSSASLTQPTIKLYSWEEVALQLRDLYKSLLASKVKL